VSSSSYPEREADGFTEWFSRVTFINRRLVDGAYFEFVFITVRCLQIANRYRETQSMCMSAVLLEMHNNLVTSNLRDCRFAQHSASVSVCSALFSDAVEDLCEVYHKIPFYPSGCSGLCRTVTARG